LPGHLVSEGVVGYEDFLAARRFPVLDGLRAIAILLVVTAHPAYKHVWPVFHGTSGVSLFFVLSGFLITTLCLREQDTRAGFSLTNFYIRRVFRIYPLYFLVLAFYVILIVGLGQQADRHHAFVTNVPYMLAFFPEHAFFFNHTGTSVPFDGAWSLGVEEKFYLVWPVLGILLLKNRLRIALLFLVFATSMFLNTQSADWAHACAPYGLIALGCFAAVLLHHRRSYEVCSHLGRPRVLAFLIVVTTSIQFGTTEVNTGRELYVVYGIVLTALLIGLITYSGNGIAWLYCRPMVFIGRISYALYLVHNFGLNAMEKLIPQTHGFASSFASTSLGLGGAGIAAWILNVWFEMPLTRLGHRIAHTRKALRSVPSDSPQAATSGSVHRGQHRPSTRKSP
jgi:peptidoglycan/LPS O-acetylase OafA/YrhL